jgi:hypothetical protein
MRMNFWKLKKAKINFKKSCTQLELKGYKYKLSFYVCILSIRTFKSQQGCRAQKRKLYNLSRQILKSETEYSNNIKRPSSWIVLLSMQANCKLKISELKCKSYVSAQFSRQRRRWDEWLMDRKSEAEPILTLISHSQTHRHSDTARKSVS